MRAVLPHRDDPLVQHPEATGVETHALMQPIFHTEVGDLRLGFVDVPGHERFIKNMLAGVGGIDLVMLVIAADEGIMPQTREHVAILELLDIPYTGSDPATLSLALDKALAKKIVRQNGINTPNFQLMATGKERLSNFFRAPPRKQTFGTWEPGPLAKLRPV